MAKICVKASKTSQPIIWGGKKTQTKQQHTQETSQTTNQAGGKVPHHKTMEKQTAV